MRDRIAYREAVAQIAQKAKAKLPECNGRVEKATALVLAGDVELHEGGTATVYSATDPTRRYELGNGYCMCKDWEQAPQHLCKHRLAAMMAKRVQELLPQVPELVEPWADNDPEPNLPETPVEAAPVPAPASLPEAPASANVRVMLHGREVQITLRDTSEERLIERLERVLARYSLPQASSQPQTPAQPASQGEGFCALHGTAMRWNDGKGGRKGWYSHKTAEGWCTGKHRR
jgi:hypothetical protein